MITKEELKRKLKAKYANKSLSDSALDKLVEIVFPTLTTESTDEQVDTAVNGVEGFVSILQSETDALRQAKAEAERKLNEKNPKPNESDPKPKGDEGNDTPAWAKAIIESNKTLSEKLAVLEAEKTTASRTSQLNTILEGLTDTQKKAYRRIKLDGYSDEEFTTELEAIKAETADQIKENREKGIVTTPPKNGGEGNHVETASDKEIESIVNNLNI